MKKKDFVTLILGTIGGILFALGMCMALLPAWGVFRQGVAVGAVGALVLAAMLVVRRKWTASPPSSGTPERWASPCWVWSGRWCWGWACA